MWYPKERISVGILGMVIIFTSFLGYSAWEYKVQNDLLDARLSSYPAGVISSQDAE